jgi:predicted amidohydrolase
VMSGYDAVFPETSRCLGIAAADIILWPASLREPFERELLAVLRAEDNRVAVVLANRVDSPYPGGSVVIPPSDKSILHQVLADPDRSSIFFTCLTSTRHSRTAISSSVFSRTVCCLLRSSGRVKADCPLFLEAPCETSRTRKAATRTGSAQSIDRRK